MGSATKFWVALIGAGVTSALTVFGPETGLGQVLVIASAILTAAAVYRFPNEPARNPDVLDDDVKIL